MENDGTSPSNSSENTPESAAISISDGVQVTAIGGTSGGWSYGIYAEVSATIISGETSTTGGVTNELENDGTSPSNSSENTPEPAAISISDSAQVTVIGGTATGDYADSCGISVYSGSISISGGTITAIGGTTTGYDACSYGIYAENDKITLDGELIIAKSSTATTSLAICGIVDSTAKQLYPNSTDQPDSKLAVHSNNDAEYRIITSSNIGDFLTSNILTLNNHILIDCDSALENVDNVKITTGSNNVIIGSLSVNGSLSIGELTESESTAGKLLVLGPENLSGDSYGISAAEDLTINSGTITAIGGTAEHKSYGIYSSNNITISGGTIFAKCGTIIPSDDPSGNPEAYGLHASSTVIVAPDANNGRGIAVSIAKTLESGLTDLTGSPFAPVDDHTAGTDITKDIENNKIFYSSILYSVTYESSGAGGEVPQDDKSYLPGAEVTVLSGSSLSRSGYTFSGWSDGAGNIYQEGDNFEIYQNVTLTAEWTKNSGGSGSGGGIPVTPSKPDNEQVVINPDGSTTTTKPNDDGTTTVITEKTEEKQHDDGTKEVTTEKKEELKDENGNIQSSIEEKTTETVTPEGTTTTEKETVIKDGDGNTVEEKTEISIEDETTGVTTSAEVTTTSEGTEVTSTTKIETDNKEVSAEMIEESLKQTEELKKTLAEKEVELNHQIEVQVNGNEAELPADSLSKLAESNTAIKVTTNAGTLELSPAAAKNLAEQSSEKISLSISEVDKDQLNERQQEVVGDAPVFDLNAKAGEQNIHDLGGTVTITVPYELKAGEDPNDIAVFYVDDNGNIVKKKSVYDPETKTISFETDHFSYYFIAAASTVPTDEEQNNTLYYLAAAIVLILVIAAIAFWLVKKKQ